MSEKKQNHVPEKKSDCGCGCIGIIKQEAKGSKSPAKKPKK